MFDFTLAAVTLKEFEEGWEIIARTTPSAMRAPSFWMTMIAGTGYVHNTFFIKGFWGWMFWPFILQPIQGVAALLLCLFVPFGGWPHVILYCSIQMAVTIWIEVQRHRLYKAEEARMATDAAALAREEM